MATINYSISFLRNDTSFVPLTSDLYYTTDIGQEGFWRSFSRIIQINSVNTFIVICKEFNLIGSNLNFLLVTII